MEPILKAERYTHGVRLSGYTRETFHKMQGFLEGLMLKEPKKIPGNRVIMELKKKYYGCFEDTSETYIHRNCLEDLIGYLANKNVPRDRIEVVDIPVPESAKAVYDMYEKYVLREYQEIIKADILRPHLHSARVDLQTGKGKTLTSLAALADLGVRCVVMVPPKYFGIWIEALQNTFKDMAQRWITISGSAELQKLIDRGIENDLDGIDVIIVSSTTYRAYLDNFEKYGNELHTLGYNAPPPRFHEAIKAGFQINDEIQEDPGLVFRTDIYSNIALQVYLSATPYTGNAYVTKMIDKMLPEETMCRLPDLDVYINCIGLLYNEAKIKPKDYLTPFKNTYNHARYETVMMKDPKRMDQYFKMVARVAEGVFIKDRLPGQKMLFLCATVAFIEKLTKYLKSRFPDLVINGHVSGCAYEQLLKNDITVSTIKSSGTGVDIPNLREVGLLQATDSKKDNIQILGRLRKLRDFPDVTPRLTFMVCETIPHHVRYAKSKRDHFNGRTLSFKFMRIAM
ncbi:DNA helicase [Pseudomonas phage PhiPA3]|uniref:Putative RAD2/SF2 helicase n=1 Tax=Pseudomonas phage PhiPA3 TaxID=998086 RepID=F8SJU7_BPPA3|nr:DNA helicase [Pseudomonas phage PhiPA3]AEH03492.1 putative RAD2/SF2 helicase [Pseudomonas phage PhiPA3]